VSPGDDPSFGDCYCFVAIEPHTKLVLNVAMGKRDQGTTDIFIESLRLATAGNFQITTDGFVPYKRAITTTLSDRGLGAAHQRSTSPRVKVKRATALRKSPQWRKSQSWADLIRPVSARQSWSAPISA